MHQNTFEQIRNTLGLVPFLTRIELISAHSPT